MKSQLSLLFVLLLAFATFGFGQENPPKEEIINQTLQQTINFQESFKNLLAVETKTFIDFDKNGAEKKKNQVIADFLVYQSSKNPKLSFELRNVNNVDGKPIPNAASNADKFFAELSKASTLKSELEKIEKSSSKYDKNFDISGLTLYEGIILSPNFRPFFEFEVEDKGESYLINYKQTKKSSDISINEKETSLDSPSLNFDVEVPKQFKNSDVFLKGYFLVDKKTFQILEEDRILFINSSEPLNLLSTKFIYQPSDYGISVPNKIELISNQVQKKDGKYITVKDFSVIFEYSKFKKTETDVKILDDSN